MIIIDINLEDFNLYKIGWCNLKYILSNIVDIKLPKDSQKIFDTCFRSYEVFNQIHHYEDYQIYKKSNYHGGNNDNFLTKHERIFKTIYPNLISQKSFGTGKGGYIKYGVKRYIADFVDEKSKTIIEIDGNSHKNELQQCKDSIRDVFFQQHGYLTIRFSNEDIENLFKLYCFEIVRGIYNEQRNN